MPLATRSLLLLCGLGLAPTLASCAAMVRTWHFSAKPVQTDALEISLTEAAVKQKVAYVTLKLHNSGTTPRRVAVDTLTLTLPDGQQVSGKTSLLGRAARGAKNALAALGLGQRSKTPELAPNQSLQAKVAFRVQRRDLRRLPRLRLDLSGIRVDDSPLSAAQLVLAAPAGAPRGEQI